MKKDVFDSKFLCYAIGSYGAAISAHKKADKSSIEKSARIIGNFARSHINDDNTFLFCGVLMGQAYDITRRIDLEKEGKLKGADILNHNMDIPNHDVATLYIFIKKFNQAASQDKQIDWDKVAQAIGVRP